MFASIFPTRSRLLCIAAAFLVACLLAAAPARAAEPAPFTAAELDQKLASIALFPDALLSQVLMAATYPSDVAQAVDWAYAHRQLEGDAAVQAVQDKPWDPSVQSLVAFPQVLAMLGENPQWVRDLGDAFLEQPGDVMDSVQFLRAKAKEAGNLASNEQQIITIEAAPPPPQVVVVTAPPPPTQIIVIAPANPRVVFVPIFNPLWAFGPWWHPAFPPFFFPPPPRWGWGWSSAARAGLLVGRRHRRVERAVGRRRLAPARRQHQRQPLEHDQRQSPDRFARPRRELAARRDNRHGVPYRGAATRDRLQQSVGDIRSRDEYRGREVQRERAREELANRVGAQNLDRGALRDIDRTQLPQRPGAPAEAATCATAQPAWTAASCRTAPRRRTARRRPTARRHRPWASPEPCCQCRSCASAEPRRERRPCASGRSRGAASIAAQSRTAPRMSIARRCKAARPASTGRNFRIAMRAPQPSTETTRCAARAMRRRRASRSIAARQARRRCSSALRVQAGGRGWHGGR